MGDGHEHFSGRVSDVNFGDCDAECASDAFSETFVSDKKDEETCGEGKTGTRGFKLGTFRVRNGLFEVKDIRGPARVRDRDVNDAEPKKQLSRFIKEFSKERRHRRKRSLSVRGSPRAIINLRAPDDRDNLVRVRLYLEHGIVLAVVGVILGAFAVGGCVYGEDVSGWIG